jgi:hypothetical protein
VQPKKNKTISHFVQELLQEEKAQQNQAPPPPPRTIEKKKESSIDMKKRGADP